MWYHSAQIVVVLLFYCNIQATNSHSLACKGINIIPTQKSLNHATLQNIDLTIYQETIKLAHIKVFQGCAYHADKYWPNFH